MRKKVTRIDEVLVFRNGFNCMESITDNNVELVFFLLEIDDLDADGLRFAKKFG